MDAQAKIAQVAVGIRFLRIRAVLIPRRDDLKGGDQLSMKVDVDGALRIEPEGNTRFKVPDYE